MNLQAHGTDPVQCAALALHALGQEDRAWILRALPAHQQSALQPLLEELRVLGIPREEGLFDAMLPPTPPARESPQPLQHLDDRQLAELAQLLAAEPPQVTAVLLGARNSPWQERLLAALPPALAEQARQRPQAAVRSAALEAAVVEELAARLPMAAAAARDSLWIRVRRKLAAVGRPA